MSDSLDFHKVSENREVEVYQAMERLDTNEMEAEDGSILAPPRKYAPARVGCTGDELDAALALFKGYDVESVTMSATDGITVRVRRAEPLDEAPEEGVTRLQVKKGE